MKTITSRIQAIIILQFSLMMLTACNPSSQYPARILKPQNECRDVQVPIMGVLDRPANAGEVIGGALIGGVIGNQIGGGSGKDIATILGAGSGAILASDQRRREPVVVGYRTEKRCEIVYR